MKNLKDLMANIEILETEGNMDVQVSSVSLNSQIIENGSLFTALVGNVVDGHKYIEKAIQNGAKVIVYETTRQDLVEFQDGVTYIKVADTHDAVAHLAINFYDNPSTKLKLVGVTGTNGKTTTVTLLYQIFTKLGYKVGMIGTTGNKIGNDEIEGVRTTPDPVYLNKLLAQMVAQGCEYCFMEVSSHAVSEKRITGLTFAGGVFTNLTHDHLDYHKTMENYRIAKKGFFDMLPAGAFALTNIDDENGEYMLNATKAKKYTYSFKKPADFDEKIETKLIGEFNAYNALAIYGTAVLLGQNPEGKNTSYRASEIKEIIKNLDAPEGRFQYFKTKNNVTAIVDYAHTPDALENVLETIHKLKSTNSKLITIIGCGGDRDKTKRPVMAGLGYAMSDILILTSDNPRSEKPEDILNDMQSGLPKENNNKVYTILDRHEAVKKACMMAESGDYIAALGKGHEKYQEVLGIKTHFDDMEELKKNLLN